MVRITQIRTERARLGGDEPRGLAGRKSDPNIDINNIFDVSGNINNQITNVINNIFDLSGNVNNNIFDLSGNINNNINDVSGNLTNLINTVTDLSGSVRFLHHYWKKKNINNHNPFLSTYLVVAK